MRVFIAGATGTLGRPVVTSLVALGHEVVGLSRTAAGARRVDELGAHGVVGDALNGDQLHALVEAARPEQVVHLLTALPPAGAARASQLRATNELRITATKHLLDSAISARARRVVAESFVGVHDRGRGRLLITEDALLPPVTPGPFADTVRALRSLEDQMLAASAARQIETVALRIGFLYGPDVPSADALIRQAKAGKLFAPRRMDGIGPFVHIVDAAAAIVAAVAQPAPSPVYNIVDDEPLPMTTFLELLTQAIGAAPPRHVPAWLVRVAAPLLDALGSATLRLSNAKAKRELGWSLRYPNVREGMSALATAAARAA